MLTIFDECAGFQDWQFRLTRAMREGIEGVYSKRPDEVEAFRSMIAATSACSAPALPPAFPFAVTCEAAELHGQLSQVKFKVGTSPYQRELADLLLLTSYVDSGRLSWQRACFVQAKRESKGRFDVDEWQLALLRAFPEFQGVSGVFKGQSLQLRSKSGMLGAYGLLSAPGKLSLLGARLIDNALGGRKSVAAKDLASAYQSSTGRPRAGWPARDWRLSRECPRCGFPFADECPDCGFPFLHWRSRSRFLCSDFRVVPPPSVESCMALDSLVQCWTALELGEPWFADSRAASDVALQSCVESIVAYTHSKTGGLTQTLRLFPSRDQETRATQQQTNENELPVRFVLSLVVSRAGTE